MLISRNNFGCRRFPKGVTLLETLAVVVVIAGLLGAASLPFAHVMQSYKNQYRLESVHMDAQRAVAEFNYYGRRAAYYTRTSSDSVQFYDTQGREVSFRFVEIGDAPDALAGKRTGILTITVPTASYTYYGSCFADSGGPFMRTYDGLVMRFFISSAGAPVEFKTFISYSSL
jgi:prepilin-type N-terminal cleavage/methylation domain-containing protein